MLLRHALGHALRRLRLEHGLTLRELSEATQVSLPYLSEIERGRKEVSSEILAILCNGLDVSLSGLLADIGADLNEGDGGRRDEVVPIPIRITRSEPAPPAERRPDEGRAGEALLLAA